MLKANSFMHELSLAWNSLGMIEDGCNHIAEGLICNNVLELLDLSNCQIGHKSASVLASSLITNTALHVLDLRWNNLGAIGGKSLLRALEHNSTLRQLKLNGNSIPEDTLLAIEAKVAQNLELHKAATADAARARFMAEELDRISATSKAQLDTLQADNETLASRSFEVQQFSNLLQERAKVNVESNEKLQARLDLHQRELETKNKEATELGTTVLLLREEVASLRSSHASELSAERQQVEATAKKHRESEQNARAESLQRQQDAAAHQLKVRLLGSEIDNQKQELARHKQWAEDAATTSQARLSEQRQRYEERALAEKEKADIELRGSQERTRTAYAQLEVVRTDAKSQMAEVQRTMEQTVTSVNENLRSQLKESANAFEARLATAKEESQQLEATLTSVNRERDTLLLRVADADTCRTRAEAEREQQKIASATELGAIAAKLEAAHTRLKASDERAATQCAEIEKLRAQMDADRASHRVELRQNAEAMAVKERDVVKITAELKAAEQQLAAIKQEEIRRFGALEQALRSMKPSSEIVA